MKVADVMVTDLECVADTASVREVATMMVEMDTRALAVCRAGALVGIVTDRDIIVRVVIGGSGTEEPVSAIMSSDVYSCTETAPLTEVLLEMERRQIRRAPVVGADGKVRGLVTLDRIRPRDDG